MTTRLTAATGNPNRTGKVKASGFPKPAEPKRSLGLSRISMRRPTDRRPFAIETAPKAVDWPKLISRVGLSSFRASFGCARSAIVRIDRCLFGSPSPAAVSSGATRAPFGGTALAFATAWRIDRAGETDTRSKTSHAADARLWFVVFDVAST